jgi:hypothetical protein
MAGKMYKWYVYKLVDPRTGAVFYIGKGTGNRAIQHQKDCNKSRAINHAKNQVISEILAAGMDCTVEYDSYFNDERSAYNQESSLIASHEFITNIVKNKFKPIVISFMQTISDSLTGRNTPEYNLSSLKKFSSLTMKGDHLSLYSCAISLTEKVISNQLLRNRVYG